MRTKIIITTTIIFCLGLILVCFFHFKWSAEDSMPGANIKNKTPNIQNSKDVTIDPTNVSDAQNNWASQSLPPGRNLQERLEELSRQRGVPLNILTQQALAHMSNAAEEWNEKINRPIELYGKTVDENE